MNVVVSRSLGVLCWIALLLAGTGCMTCNVLHDARQQVHQDASTTLIVDRKAQPIRYALLPLTIPADIITSPIQAVGYMFGPQQEE